MQELDSCNAKLKTDHDDNLVGQKYKLLDERADLLYQTLTPLRTAVSGLLDIKPNMAASKKWAQDFKKLPPSDQLNQYTEACTIARNVATLLLIELPETGKP